MACTCAKGTLSLVGDVLIRKERPLHTQLEKVNFDPTNLVGPLLPKLQAADILFLNYEGAITTSAERKHTLLPLIFYIQSDPQVVSFLKSLNSTLVCSLANNHIADFGITGILDTRHHLKEAGIYTTGIGTLNELTSPPVLTIKGARVTFLSFTDLLPAEYFSGERVGVFKLTEENIKRAVASARDLSDVVIVALHTCASVTAPFQTYADHAQKRFAYVAADAGAHLIVGHQPHGLQEVERRNGAYIFHSIGAFIYNPGASALYSKKHRLHHGTQFYGGSILTTLFCIHGIEISEWLPTHCEVADNGIYLKEGTLVEKLKARSSLLLA